MKEFTIGVALAAILLVGVIVAPNLTRSEASIAAVQASEQAELSRRRLHAHDPMLELISGQAQVAGLQDAIRDNRAALEDAKTAAQAAQKTSSLTIGVAQAAGAAGMVEASERMVEARRLRMQAGAAISTAARIAERGAALNARREHYSAFNPSSLSEQLQSDVDEFEALQTAAEQVADALGKQVFQRKSVLERLALSLTRGRAELLSMREVGFTPGDDSSFDAYRERYLALSGEMRLLQLREQSLRDGKVPDDANTRDLQGFDTSIGLDELERRLQIARDRARKLDAAVDVMRKKHRAIADLTDDSAAQSKRLTEQLNDLKKELGDAIAVADGLAQQAVAKEDQAADSARRAVTAFREARTAVDARISKARDVQNRFDPQRKNRRLTLIVNDEQATRAAIGSLAQANALLGRIYAEHVLGDRAQLEALERMAQAVPDQAPDTQPLRDAIASNLTSASESLNTAREGFENLESADAPTRWIHQASLAVVYHLLSLVDTDNAAQHRGNAIERIQTATAGAEQSPYLAAHVRFLEALTGQQ